MPRYFTILYYILLVYTILYLLTYEVALVIESDVLSDALRRICLCIMTVEAEPFQVVQSVRYEWILVVLLC